jgi:biotin carboxyl carrier protein
MSELTTEVIEHALTVARRNGFTDVELSHGAHSFRARLEPGTGRGAPAPLASPDETITEVRANQVGYYSAGPNPLCIGDRVEPGDIVATVIALGIPTEVEAVVGGEVVEILAEDGQPVEYGQVMLRIKEAQ